jgi:TRAP-type C4-dicarboxylate transport system permease large subunit
MGIGLFAPPFGVGFFTACAIGRVEPDDGDGRASGPISARCSVAVIVVAAIPCAVRRGFCRTIAPAATAAAGARVFRAFCAAIEKRHVAAVGEQPAAARRP